ncbi:MAG: hypothetical protein A2V98_06010 [Planctomycetes bacterium RBG_16_64_12]|nr:MAG: hypothetical protein A2V98_06010 [Planctomycetes bacterium RBG_16_64_12]
MAPALLVLLQLAAAPSAAPENFPPPAGIRPANAPAPVKVLRYCRRLVEKYDQNSDGRLQEHEWAAMLLNKYDHDGDKRLEPDEWDAPRVKRYDSNRDGSLDEAEWQRIWKSLGLAGSEAGIAVDELARRVTTLGRGKPIALNRSHLQGRLATPSFLNPTIGPGAADATERPKPSREEATGERGQEPPAGPAARRGTKFFVPTTQLPQGLPSWFVLRDADGDAQLTMVEFAPKATQSQLDEFAGYDHNGDGVITAKECAQGPKRAGKQPAEEEAGEEATEAAAEADAEAAATGSQWVPKARTGNQRKKPSQKPTSDGTSATASGRPA